MYKYSITKYKPLIGDAEEDDWTSISDIGEIFAGEMLTLESYKKTEDTYIQAIHLIMDYLNVPYLTIIDVRRSFPFEMFQDLIKNHCVLYTEDMLVYYSNVKNNDNLNKEEIDVYCRLLLREQIGSRVFYPRKMKVFIGDDYLMGFHTSRPLDPIICSIEKTGLYVENFT